MTSKTLILAPLFVAGLALTACGEREAAEPAPAVAVSEAVPEAAPSETLPAVVAASDAAVTAPVETIPTTEPTDLDPDEVAAAGDTRRRGEAAAAPEAPAAEEPPAQ